MSSNGKQTTLFDDRPAYEADQLVSEQRLRQMYINEKKSKDEIREELGCNRGRLLKKFDEYGIKQRSSQEQYALNRDTRYRDKEFLKRNYIEQGKTMREIADMCGCSGSAVSRWIEKHGIEKRRSESEVRFRLSGPRSGGMEGYPTLSRLGCDEVPKLLEHRLVLLAEGHSIKEVFGDNNYNIHHRNGHKCDNRPSNLELVDRREHGRKHSHTSWKKWSDDDIESVIHFMLDVRSNHPDLR